MMRIILLFVFLLSAVLTVPHDAFAQTSNETVTVSEIAISGNSRVSDSTINAYLPVRVGDAISEDSLDNAIDSLFATKLFNDVTINIEGTRISIAVVENPIVNRVNIEGNDVLDDERLLAELDIQPRRIFTRKVAVDATQKLLEIYRLSGRYAAEITPQVIRLDNNRVDLIFEVDEGPLIKVTSISFIGNETFSDFALRQVISSRQVRWWAFLSSVDKYDESRLDYDARLLRQFYLGRGYANIEIKRAQGGLLADRSGFALTFEIDEGTRYKLRDVSFTSQITDIDVSKFRDDIPLEKGDWYNVKGLEQGLLNVTNSLGNLGYAFVDVRPQVTPDTDSNELDIEISIGEGRKNYIERIEVVNNSRTRDTVIRRELEVVEGDPYNQLKLDKSLRNIKNLGFFRTVDISTVRGSADDQTIAKINVEEQSTGDFSIGVGYSSLDKSTVSLGINERNFLGSGRGLKFSTSLSESRSDYRLGLTEPYFLDRDLHGSAEIFNQRLENSTLTTKTTGVNLGVAFDAADDYYHRIGYELSSADSTQSSTTATSLTGEENKDLLRSALSYTIGRSTLDNRFDPTEGYLYELDETVSGLGGDVTFVKTSVRASYFKPLSFNSFILGVRGRAGFVDGLGEKVTQSARFYLGGRTVRGFDSSGIGPRDTGTNSAVGGNYMYSATAEIVSSYGLSEDLGVRWTVFSDIGSVWDVDYQSGVTGANDDLLRQSVGVGFLWDTAIGPLTFYWADAVSKSSHDQLKRFQFNIGTRL
ncbi:MAG: outer membrane protein assembly factor BamA [Alphaproteobacteria bacterium]|nr:outer membrane protein assembly factor BamA [Alphaproteobacteria bacterium]